MGNHLHSNIRYDFQWNCVLIPGVFKIPTVTKTEFSLPVNIICDNIREPGNLGSILRTCAAVGCKSVILTKGAFHHFNWLYK